MLYKAKGYSPISPVMCFMNGAESTVSRLSSDHFMVSLSLRLLVAPFNTVCMLTKGSASE